MHTKCKFISDRKKWLESNEIKMMNLFNISGDSGYQLQSCVSWQCWALVMSRLSRTRQRCSCSDSLTSTLNQYNQNAGFLPAKGLIQQPKFNQHLPLGPKWS